MHHTYLYYQVAYKDTQGAIFRGLVFQAIYLIRLGHFTFRFVLATDIS